MMENVRVCDCMVQGENESGESVERDGGDAQEFGAAMAQAVRLIPSREIGSFDDSERE